MLECVPNFSEGSDEATLSAITAAVLSVPGQKLLHTDPSPSANRTVFTFAGEPAAVVEAAFRAIKAAADHIDMRRQGGAHPRIGATDVCPLVPLAGMSMQDAVFWSEKLAQRVGDELQIPVYLYEHSAKAAQRRALPDIRKGQYEGLSEKMQLPAWQPDYGPTAAGGWEKIAPTGATIIGARDILVAFNISLNTKDVNIAKAIARQMRSSSKGILPALRAIGWYMDDFDCAQVSMNLLDYRVTAPLQVWETCQSLALNYGVELIGCEVVGLIPENCVLEAGAAALNRNRGIEDKDLFIKAGIGYLGLDRVKPFDPQQKILEQVLEREGLL